jgi:hypothetical protein
MPVSGTYFGQPLFRIAYLPHLTTKGIMFAIHDCFLDDSKDERQEIAYVCAGFYGSEEVWQSFDKAWRKQLKAEGIDYFKSSECNNLSGQFDRWRNLPQPLGRQAADQIRQRLKKTALGFRGLHGVGTALPVEEHEAVLRHENANRIFPENHLYHRVFETTLLGSTRAACINPRDLMLFIHDDGPDFRELLAIFKDFKGKNPIHGRRLTCLLAMDDTVTPALQLADMFANSVQRLTVDLLKGEGSFPSDFMFDRSDLRVWTREIGELELAHNLKQRGIAVPKSLTDAISEHPKYSRRYPKKMPG